MGNRGCIHDDQGQLTAKRWAHQAWVSCQLEFKGWKRELMTPTYYTELFFTDEAVALAAGHRPCGTCRHRAYKEFQIAFAKAFPEFGERPKPDQMNKVLHRDRVNSFSKEQVTHKADINELPFGTFIEPEPGKPVLITQGGYLLWSFEGYSEFEGRIAESVTVLTPRAIVKAMQCGYSPAMDC
ncbi:hypothetical protein [Hyphobacterium sp.]|uniref:hypothetical protein n=1 Tax=Hyphobacterium sp. TaxID=2004662 RepID=UPI003BAAA4A5